MYVYLNLNGASSLRVVEMVCYSCLLFSFIGFLGNVQCQDVLILSITSFRNIAFILFIVGTADETHQHYTFSLYVL